MKSTSLPLSIAWEAFGPKNGAAHRDGFEKLVRGLLTDPTVRDPEIGCTVLAQPFFWPRDTWISDPIDFATAIVRGRYYDTAEPPGAQLWAGVQSRLTAPLNASPRAGEPARPERYGAPLPVRPRLGQGAFRVLVTDAYQRRCALTGESTLPVLEAAHIQPYSESGPHDPANGLLLRSDFHKLFDIGLVTVTPDHRIEVSPRIREEWFNGKAYYRLHGHPQPLDLDGVVPIGSTDRRARSLRARLPGTIQIAGPSRGTAEAPRLRVGPVHRGAYPVVVGTAVFSHS